MRRSDWSQLQVALSDAGALSDVIKVGGRGFKSIPKQKEPLDMEATSSLFLKKTAESGDFWNFWKVAIHQPVEHEILNIHQFDESHETVGITCCLVVANLHQMGQFRQRRVELRRSPDGYRRTRSELSKIILVCFMVSMRYIRSHSHSLYD